MILHHHLRSAAALVEQLTGVKLSLGFFFNLECRLTQDLIDLGLIALRFGYVGSNLNDQEFCSSSLRKGVKLFAAPTILESMEARIY